MHIIRDAILTAMSETMDAKEVSDMMNAPWQ